MQKKIDKSNPSPLDTSTVQSSLEIALNKLHPAGAELTISSRTDKGVHALHSAVHVDLERQNGRPYDVKYLTSVLNRNLYNGGLPIRVLRADIVPDTFHCRYSAKGRSYLYRLAIAKDYHNLEEGYRGRANFINYVPIEEANRCWFVHSPEIDIERVNEASQLFVGRHDFRTFMNAKRKNDNSDHPMYTLRKIDSISIAPGRPLITSQSKKADLYNYWDIQLKGRSFLYKQVRRIVGTLVALGQGKINEKDIYEMLTIPSKYNWISNIPVAPPYGLYLAKVDYDFSALNLDKDESPGSVAGEEGNAEAHRHES